jgi:acyl-coenzyme A synthetase/AMP-(fatty) acid ligase
MNPLNQMITKYFPSLQFNIASLCFIRNHSNDIAIISSSESTGGELCTITFAELNHLSNRVAYFLRTPKSDSGLGLQYGDRIGICMPMTPESVAVYLGDNGS